MELKEVLENTLSTDLVQAEKMIERAEGEVTFWGGRKVTIQGYQGSVSLEWLRHKMIAVMPWRSHPVPIKVAFLNLGDKFEILCKKIDEKLAKSNIITRLFFDLRHFSLMSNFEREYDFPLRDCYSPIGRPYPFTEEYVAMLDRHCREEAERTEAYLRSRLNETELARYHRSIGRFSNQAGGL